MTRFIETHFIEDAARKLGINNPFDVMKQNRLIAGCLRAFAAQLKKRHNKRIQLKPDLKRLQAGDID